MARRKHKRLQQDPELDITAFMNLMIVLVPVLLLSMVFAHTTVLELNFPALDQSILNEDLKNEQLQLLIRKEGFELSSSKAGLLRHIPKIKNGDESAYDFKSLSKVLQDVKRLLPDKDDITILLEPSTSYQTLVTTMDTTRSYKAVLIASVVDAALFPDISLGDAPTLVAKPSNVGNQQESQ